MLDSILSLISYLGPFSLLIGILVFFHELGHFLVARYYGVRVEVFSLGFGKKILQYKQGETTYCLSLIPLGGYVKMFGDDPNQTIEPNLYHQAFLKKPVGQRIGIVLAGPLMNVLLAFVLYFILALTGETKEKAIIGDLHPSERLYQMGLRPGDLIVSINEKPISYWEQIQHHLKENQVTSVLTFVKRGEEQLQFNLPVELIENPNPVSSESKIPWIKGLNNLNRLPVIGLSNPQSLAGKSGLQNFDQILKINGLSTETFYELEKKLLSLNPPFSLEVQNFQFDSEAQTAPIRTITIPYKIDQLSDFGIYNPETFILKLNPDMPAAQKDLRVGDQILKLDEVPIHQFSELLEKVKNFKEGQQPLKVEIMREGQSLVKEITPVRERIKQESESRYLLGLISATFLSPPSSILIKETSLLNAFLSALNKTILGTKMIFVGLYKMLINKISPKNISGILTIGVIAKKSFSLGLSTFLQMMAILSLNLFVMNLLPIPVLDGGHLLFFTLEALKGSPISLEKMAMAQHVGLFIILGLMLFAFFNDVSSLFFSQW